MPVNYLNLYLLAVFGGLAATVGGILICYNGISETSYVTGSSLAVDGGVLKTVW